MISKEIYTPLVSIITPAYNAAPFITDTIKSVLEQDFTLWEHIIVDDGSTDNTAEIVQQYAKSDHRIIYLHQENGRQGKARNLAISVARGQYLAFLDADDLWLSHKLSLQMAFLNLHPHVDLLYTQGYFLYADGSGTDFDAQIGTSEVSDLPRLLKGNYIPILSVVVKTESVRQAGGFTESPALQNVEDYELWMRMLNRGGSFHGLEERLFRYRVHPQQCTQNDPDGIYRSLSAAKAFIGQSPAAKKAYRKEFQAYILELNSQAYLHKLAKALSEYTELFIPPVGRPLLGVILNTSSPTIRKRLCRILFSIAKYNGTSS